MISRQGRPYVEPEYVALICRVGDAPVAWRAMHRYGAIRGGMMGQIITRGDGERVYRWVVRPASFVVLASLARDHGWTLEPFTLERK